MQGRPRQVKDRAGRILLSVTGIYIAGRSASCKHNESGSYQFTKING